MKKVYIIQPAVPKYRVPFFKNISKHYDLSLIASEVDFLGVKSEVDINDLSLVGNFINIFNIFYWQRFLPLWRGYNNAKIVVINGNPRVLNYMLLLLLLKIRGIPTVWWGHGWSAGSYGLLSKIRLLISKLATARLFYTDYEMQQVNVSNTYSLNNGLNSDEIKEARRGKDYRSYGNSKIELIFIGRLTKKSNLAFLIKNMKYINDEVHLKVIGDGELIGELKQIVTDSFLGNRVTFLGPVFDECTLTQHMNMAHAFIYPGSVGLSLIHAFNYGLPAILHNNRHAHMPEFAAFKDGINGLSYSEGSDESLIRTINNFSVMNKVELEVLSANALKTIEETYNTKDMFKRFDEMVKDVL
ncbi:glycosyltransferase family 4 protein [Proteus terrae]|uniref:glycosyltransferase family 4 protein n=1 Tax=Proteus terrae TaxID=1574161 RepID=UPI001CBC8CDA|nr:glycosyltransferase family 4 protein [Proteus terrae]